MKLTVTLVCFNEKQTILKAIEEAMALSIDKEVIVVDNCSTDGTKEILEGLKDGKELKIILHSKNMGGGYSILEGLRLARGKYFYTPGADLEYKMSDVYKMIDKAEKENLDAVFGSRLLSRTDVSKIQLIKERPYWLGTIIATFLINNLFHKKFTDVIGISLVKTDLLRSLNIKSNWVAYQFELVSKLCKYGYKIAEILLWYKPRTREEGKTIRAIDMIPAIITIFKVKFSRNVL